MKRCDIYMKNFQTQKNKVIVADDNCQSIERQVYFCHRTTSFNIWPVVVVSSKRFWLLQKNDVFI